MEEDDRHNERCGGIVGRAHASGGSFPRDAEVGVGGGGVVWDVGGVVGPLLYHTHVPCRIAAADALEGGCIAMMQKIIRYEGKANLQTQLNDSDDEEDEQDPAYQARVIAAVEDALRQVVVRWLQELTGQWLVRCHNLILRVEPENHSDARPGRIFVHSKALGHPSSRAHQDHQHCDPTTSLPHQRTTFLWCSATEKKSKEVEQHQDPGSVGGEGLRDMRAGGLGVGLSEGVAKDREGMYRQLQLLVPHVSSLGWLSRMLRQVYMYVCMYIYMYMYTYTHTHTHIYIYVYLYIYMYIYLYIYIYIHMCVCIYVYYIYVCVFMYRG